MLDMLKALDFFQVLKLYILYQVNAETYVGS